MVNSAFFTTTVLVGVGGVDIVNLVEVGVKFGSEASEFRRDEPSCGVDWLLDCPLRDGLVGLLEPPIVVFTRMGGI